MTASVDSYLAALPEQQRTVLQHLRAVVLSAVPNAEEAIRTRVPAIRYRGKTVVGFGAGAHHLALYVMFGEALLALARDFRGFDVSSRVVRFSVDRPIPDALLRKVVRLRLAEIETQLRRTARR